MRIRTALFLALSLATAACGGGNNTDHREYTLQGQVLSVQPDHKQAVIRHEEIPGFMGAMTMPYEVGDAGASPSTPIRTNRPPTRRRAAPAYPQRPDFASTTVAAAVPAVEVRSTVGPIL